MNTSTTPTDAGTRRRILTVAASTVALVIGGVVVAQARGGGFETVPYAVELFYGDFDDDLLLFAGATAEDQCVGDAPTADGRLFERRDGSTDLKVNTTNQPLHLYATPMDAIEFIEVTCAALGDDDPATRPLAPMATGTGHVKDRIREAADGTVHVVNSTKGTVSATTGERWQVRGWADLQIVDGVPVGSPEDFQGLDATEVG